MGHGSKALSQEPLSLLEGLCDAREWSVSPRAQNP